MTLSSRSCSGRILSNWTSKFKRQLYIDNEKTCKKILLVSRTYYTCERLFQHTDTVTARSCKCSRPELRLYARNTGSSHRIDMKNIKTKLTIRMGIKSEYLNIRISKSRFAGISGLIEFIFM